MKWFFGKKEADRLTTFPSITINAGFGIGGINKMIELLEIWSVNMKRCFVSRWGYEQSLLNYLYYNNYLKTINFVVEKCTQRMCFGAKTKINERSQTFVLIDKQCAPVVIHKDFPESMKRLFII